MSYRTANVCADEFSLSKKIAFNYTNETYLISTYYVIDYNKKIINELHKLGILIINNYPDCNWYLIKNVLNTGVNTGNIYIQGPNYNVSNVQNVIDFLENNYPITETLVGISLGLILPCILLVLFVLYRQLENNYTENLENLENVIKREIDNKIKDFLFNPPSYELVYSINTFKENLKYEYNKYYHGYINKKFEEYTKISNGNDNESRVCIKCKSEKLKLYKNKYDLYECEKCQL
jgi:hypothetical protein